MSSKTLLKLSFLKSIKEKFNLHESPKNQQTKETANATGGEANEAEKPAQDDLNKDRSDTRGMAIIRPKNAVERSTREEDDLSDDTKIYYPKKRSVLSSTDHD